MEQSGLAKIEWVILLAITAIITVMALSSYHRYELRAHRSDARSILKNTVKSLKVCHSSSGSYKASTCPVQAGKSFVSRHGHYKISVKISNNKKFTLIAAARGSQKGDRTCEDFLLNQAGKKHAYSAKGVDTSTTCW